MGLMENYEKYQKEMFDILKRKNADYATKVDSYSNFTKCEAMNICNTETGILVRMIDKMARISNLTRQEAQVKDESIKDTLLDLANYSMILASYIEDKKKVQ